MTLTLDLSPDLQQRLEAAAQAQGVTPGQFAVRILDEELSAEQRRRDETIKMLRSWREEGEAEEDRVAYEELTAALDEDRPSFRKLFPPELKGISW